MSKGDKMLDRVISEQMKKKLEEMGRDMMKLKSDNQNLHQKLAKVEAGELPEILDQINESWISPVDIEPRREIRMVDPIYGELLIEPELVEIFMQPLIQRLNYVRQLSFTYFDHPMAQHTRLAHSLGVAKNAEMAVAGVLSRGSKWSATGKSALILSKPAEQIRVAKLAGMLHDIGHGPFGHALDRLVGYKKGMDLKDVDKIYSGQYIEKHLSEKLTKFGFDPPKLAKLVGIKNEAKYPLPGFDHFLGELVDSAIDVDRMDYLVRDAYATGLKLGFVNAESLIERMVPYEGEDQSMSLEYAYSGLPFVEHFLYARDVMYVNCYEEDRKAAAEEMLVKAVQEMIDKLSIDVDQLMLLDDLSLVHLALQLGTEGDLYYRMMKMLVAGRLYKKAYEVNFAKMNKSQAEFIRQVVVDTPGVAYFKETDSRAEALTSAHSTFKGSPWKVLVVFPSPNVFRQDEANVKILLDDEKTWKRAGEVSQVINPIAKVIQDARLVLRVFVTPEAKESEIEELARCCKRQFEPV